MECSQIVKWPNLFNLNFHFHFLRIFKSKQSKHYWVNKRLTLIDALAPQAIDSLSVDVFFGFGWYLFGEQFSGVAVSAKFPSVCAVASKLVQGKLRLMQVWSPPFSLLHCTIGDSFILLFCICILYPMSALSSSLWLHHHHHHHHYHHPNHWSSSAIVDHQTSVISNN